MQLPRLFPLSIVIKMATSVFSPPRSHLTREGRPNAVHAWVKRLNTAFEHNLCFIRRSCLQTGYNSGITVNTAVGDKAPSAIASKSQE